METGKQRLVIEELDKVSIVLHTDIVCCKAYGNYSEIFMKDKTSILWCRRIGILERELNDPNFIRVSQSLLINKNYLKRIHKKDKKIELIGGILLSYSMNTNNLVSFLKPKNNEKR